MPRSKIAASTLFGRFNQAPLTEIPFELPSSVTEEKFQLKIGLAEFDDKGSFQMPAEFIAHLVARERPPKYRRISKNVFSDSNLKFRRPRAGEIEKCACKDIDERNRKLKQNDLRSPPAPVNGRKRNATMNVGPGLEVEVEIQACGDDCLNRAVQQECTDASCSYKDSSLCTNRQLTRRQHVKVAPVRTDMKGWGLRVLDDVSDGQFLHEYVGDVISTETCINRLRQQYATAKKGRVQHGDIHHYFLTLSEDMIIDAQARGGVCRFLNHSCNPNCEIQIWKTNNEPHAGLFARRDIAAGSELTIDYRYDGLDENIVKTQPCFCGEPTCAKVIGGTRRVVDSKKAKRKRKMGKQAQKRMREFAQRLGSDSLCSICGEVGELIMCDGTVDGRDCPRCYHYSCLNKEQVPSGKWICPYHFCDGCGKLPVVFCRTCSDSWCQSCADKADLKPTEKFPEDSGKVKFVLCSDCFTEPLNPVRDVETVSRLMKDLEQLQALAERILKGQKPDGGVLLDCEAMVFHGPKMPRDKVSLLVAATMGKDSLTEASSRLLATKLGVQQSKIEDWFQANQVLLGNPLNFFSDKVSLSPSTESKTADLAEPIAVQKKGRTLVSPSPSTESKTADLAEPSAVIPEANLVSRDAATQPPEALGLSQGPHSKIKRKKGRARGPPQRKRLSAMAV